MAQAKTKPALPVLEGEEPWTDEEIAELKAELEADVAHMTSVIAKAEADLTDLMGQGTDGAGRDSADISSSNFERDQEMALTQNARSMLEQSQLALRLLADGEYGRCEICGEPIGKLRLQVFPRATTCVACKQREERR